jgi:hypothetical protein
MGRVLLGAAALAVAAGAGCITSQQTIVMQGNTSIITTPPGARAYVNGVEVCTATPCSWNEGDGMSQRYRIQLRLEGYRDVDLFVDKEMLFFGGTLQAMGYRMPRQLTFKLEPADGAPAAPPPPVPAGPPPAVPTPPPQVPL